MHRAADAGRTLGVAEVRPTHSEGHVLTPHGPFLGAGTSSPVSQARGKALSTSDPPVQTAARPEAGAMKTSGPRARRESACTEHVLRKLATRAWDSSPGCPPGPALHGDASSRARGSVHVCNTRASV